MAPPHFPTDPACIFCKIIAGQIPSAKVFEDDMVFAFLDIGPLTPGHTLVVPKAHYENIFDIPTDVFAETSRRLPLLAQAVAKTFAVPACHLLINNGPEALQSVRHLHYHIIPRQHGDAFHMPWNAGKLEPARAAAMVKAVMDMLNKLPKK